MENNNNNNFVQSFFGVRWAEEELELSSRKRALSRRLLTDGAEWNGAEHEKTFYMAKRDSFITWKFLNADGMLLPLFNYAFLCLNANHHHRPAPLSVPLTSLFAF